MEDILIAFSLGEFLQWIFFGFCFAFIFQGWQKKWLQNDIGSEALLIIFLALGILGVLFFIGGATITILSVLAFGIGLLLQLSIKACVRLLFGTFLFLLRPKENTNHSTA